MFGKFVTAKLKGKAETRQGAIINENPLIIRGQSGAQYRCEGEPILVSDPPPKCIGCNLPLGKLCVRCEAQLKGLLAITDKNGLVFDKIETEEH